MHSEPLGPCLSDNSRVPGAYLARISELIRPSLGEEHAQVRAALEAQEIAASPDKLQQLLRDVEQIEAERAAELLPARGDLDRFKAMVRRHIESPYEDHGKLVTAIRVLTYLRDPYDAIMDQYVDLGLQDDVALIRSAARSLASGGTVGAKG